MNDKYEFFACPLCGKSVGGWDKHNNTVWCDNDKCALSEEVSTELWISIHKRIKECLEKL